MAIVKDMKRSASGSFARMEAVRAARAVYPERSSVKMARRARRAAYCVWRGGGGAGQLVAGAACEVWPGGAGQLVC
jgi:hypothetical protein